MKRQRAMMPGMFPPPVQPETVVKLTWPVERIHALIALATECAQDSHRLVVEAGRQFGLRPNTTYQFFAEKPKA